MAVKVCPLNCLQQGEIKGICERSRECGIYSAASSCPQAVEIGSQQRMHVCLHQNAYLQNVTSEDSKTKRQQLFLHKKCIRISRYLLLKTKRREFSLQEKLRASDSTFSF